jgi:hypothetical protein
MTKRFVSRMPMKSFSPTQLSLDLLRKTGWQAEVVEHFVRQHVGHELPPCPTCKQARYDRDELGYRKDLFGFLDILALKDGATLGVQTTSVANVSHRMHKIQCSAWFEWVKRAGWRIEVHGWGERGGVRVIDMTKLETKWDSILKAGPRNRKTPRTQATLL